MKISIFIPSLERGGVERNVVNLSKGLLDSGYMVDLLVKKISNEFRNQLPDKVNLIKLEGGLKIPDPFKIINYRIKDSFELIPLLMNYIKDQKPNTVISFQSNVTAIISKIFSSTDINLIVRESNTATVANRSHAHWFSPLATFFKKILYSKADKIVAVSKGVASDLINNLKILQNKVSVIYNPTYNLEIIEKSKEPVNHKWIGKGEHTVLISVGRLTKQKDYETLLRAFKIVREKSDVKLVIIGEGEDRIKIENLISSLNLKDHVDLMGFTSNPYKYVAKSDIFILSSIFEGLPNVLIEAAALKRPIVATDCQSGPKEILLDGKAGILVPIKDHEKMAEKILYLLNDPLQCEKFVTVGFENIERFTQDRAIEDYKKILVSK